MIVFYLSVVVWVFKDARRRIDDRVLVACDGAAGRPPFIGAFVYMLFRPPEYLEDVRERELEIKAMEGRLGGRDLHCPVCRAEVDPSYLVCPVCTTRLARRAPAAARRSRRSGRSARSARRRSRATASRSRSSSRAAAQQAQQQRLT